MQTHLLIHDKHINNVIFDKTQQNKVLNNCNYTKLLYSTCSITLNGLYFHVPLIYTQHYKHFNKYILSFDNVPVELYDIMSLEKTILYKKFPTKKPTYHILKIIQAKQINFYSYNNINLSNPCIFILKISGIWSNKHECGLAVRIYPSVITK